MGPQHSNTPSPCQVFALGCSSCPVPRALGRAWCRILPVLHQPLSAATPQSQTSLPGLGAPWALTSEARASLLSSVEEIAWVLGWVLWCLHGQSGPGLLSACRQLRETWLSHKTCWKRKLSSITALVRRLHVAGHDPGSGADQEGRIWIRPGRRC